jgi:hypothetical protein
VDEWVNPEAGSAGFSLRGLDFREVTTERRLKPTLPNLPLALPFKKQQSQ